MTQTMFRLLSHADFRGGRTMPRCKRRDVAIVASDLMATAAGGKYVALSALLTAAHMAEACMGGCQPEDEWDG